jgi:hypothetical protein
VSHLDIFLKNQISGNGFTHWTQQTLINKNERGARFSVAVAVDSNLIFTLLTSNNYVEY